MSTGSTESYQWDNSEHGRQEHFINHLPVDDESSSDADVETRRLLARLTSFDLTSVVAAISVPEVVNTMKALHAFVKEGEHDQEARWEELCSSYKDSVKNYKVNLEELAARSQQEQLISSTTKLLKCVVEHIEEARSEGQNAVTDVTSSLPRLQRMDGFHQSRRAGGDEDYINPSITIVAMQRKLDLMADALGKAQAVLDSASANLPEISSEFDRFSGVKDLPQEQTAKSEESTTTHVSDRMSRATDSQTATDSAVQPTAMEDRRSKKDAGCCSVM